MRMLRNGGLRAALLLLAGGAAYGGQSLVLTSSTPNSTGTLSGNAVYNNVSSWRVEGQFDNLVTPSGPAGVWELDSIFSIRIFVDAARKLVLRGYNNNEGATVALGSTASGRFVAQRNAATGKYTLEVWDMQTGEYKFAEGTIQTAGTADFRNNRFSIGSLYEPANLGVRLGHLRWYSITRPLGRTPPELLLSSGYGNLLNYEFEGNLNDSGPQHISFSLASGSPTYAATASYGPGVLLANPPITQRAGEYVQLDGSASFSNVDSPAIQCTWQSISGGAGFWRDQNQCKASFAPPTSGSYTLRLRVTDGQGNAGAKEFTIGAVATDENGAVAVVQPEVSQLLGPMLRYGANPWAWADNRHKAVADFQMALMDTYFQPYWNTPNLHGTVSVSAGSTTVVGTDTQFQNDFCGGAGNTTPVAATRGIYIWYPSPDFPGQSGRGRYIVESCNTQEQLTLTWAYGHSDGAAAGLNYQTVNPDGDEFPWVFSGIPANYYDNILAYYSLYYRTGHTAYRDAARTLAQRFWTGPNWDRGASYNTARLGGRYITAGPARGQAVTGLLVWALESNADIWPGLHHLWDYWMGAAQFQLGVGQMGDVREMGYITAGLALCARYDISPTYRSNCAAKLNQLIDNMWTPLQINGHWRNTLVERFFGGSGVFVKVVDGSPLITLNGATWAAGDFTRDQALDRWAWFITDPNKTSLAGKQNSDVGDTVAYKVQSVTDTTHALLTNNYNSGGCPPPSGCNRALVLSTMPGFGVQPFMLGLAMGGMGTYVHGYYVSAGDTARAAKVKQFVADGVGWLSSTGFDVSNMALYQARGFLTCEPNPNSNGYCWANGARSLAGEAIQAFSADYLLNESPVTLDTMDRIYQGIFAKPGFAAPFTPDGTYLVDLDDPGVPGAYMLSDTSFSNKWLGFFFGYGGGASWPAARVGGPDKTPARGVSIPVDFAAVAGAARVRITVTTPAGISTETVCSLSPCSINVEDRLGNHQIQVDYLTEAGELLAPGEPALLPVRAFPSRRR